jgi:hypothetical protein
VEELHEQAGPMALDRIGHAAEAGDDLGPVAGERVGRQEPGGMHRGPLQHDQADAAARPRLVVGDEVVGRQMIVNERRLVRRRDDPVRQLDGADSQRVEEMLEQRRSFSLLGRGEG